MKKLLSVTLIIFFTLQNAICAFAKTPQVAKSQLEVRQIQTRVFDTTNKTVVLKAAINTLQDQGYIILNIEDELGYIQAKKEYKAVRIDKKRLTAYYFLLTCYGVEAVCTHGATAYNMTDAIKRINNETSPRTIIVDSNVTIEPFGNKTRVRFTLIEKELETADGYSYIKSSPRRVVRFYSEPIYQEFFSGLDKNIYYENNV